MKTTNRNVGRWMIVGVAALALIATAALAQPGHEGRAFLDPTADSFNGRGHCGKPPSLAERFMKPGRRHGGIVTDD